MPDEAEQRGSPGEPWARGVVLSPVPAAAAARRAGGELPAEPGVL